MDTLKAVLMVLVLLFGGAAFFLFIQVSTYRSEVSDAADANMLTLQLLRIQGASCNAAAQDFTRTGECIAPLLQQKDFKEDGFGQPDEKKQTPGFVVIKNINHQSYDAAKFTFFYNRQLTQTGCTIPGT